MLGIVLTILGIVAIVVCAINVYRTAIDTGRSAGLWTLLTIGLGLFFQFVVPFFVGLVIGVYLVISGTPLEKSAVNTFGLLFILEIACLVFSVVGMFFVMNRAAIVPDYKPASSPPPPTF